MCNQVDDFAGNEDSTTKQARGDSGKEPKLHRWQNGEKTLGETRLSRGASFPLARRTSSLFHKDTLHYYQKLFEINAV